MVQIHEDLAEDKPSSAANTALTKILAFIQDHHLRPGDQLPSESKLAEECGVGKGTVRETVRSLAQLGILNVRNGRRAEVAEVNGDNVAILINHAVQTAQVSVIQTWDFRQTIEARIARLAALRRTPDQIQNMRNICEEMMSLLDDPVALSGADVRLHIAWAEAANNLIYLLNMQSLATVMRWTGPIGYAAIGDREAKKKHVDLHVGITEAIANQRADDAVELMLQHFVEARTSMLDAGFK